MKVIARLLPFLVSAFHACAGAKTEHQTCAGSHVPLIDPVEPRIFFSGKSFSMQEWTEKSGLDSAVSLIESPSRLLPIQGCCSEDPIGHMPQMTTDESLDVLDAAVKGYSNGAGIWPQMTLRQRIDAIEKFITTLEISRERIIDTLMWEIGKNFKDAESEFDRTIAFIRQTIETIETHKDFSNKFNNVSGSTVMIRRNSFGILLALGPYNYPLNETYATIIPALLMGNIVILKIPQVGGLAHLLTFEAFAEALPENTIHFISGGGRKTLPKLMESGKVDGLAFIGGTSAADKLIKQHPSPHRLKTFLQLEAKNMAIVMKDMFTNEEKDDEYSRNSMFRDIITGSLSYNGQRCTALKIIFVPKGKGKYVAEELAKRVENLTIGMPWEKHDIDGSSAKKSSMITPLPNQNRVDFMNDLLTDAVSKGAIKANELGGTIIDSSSECTGSSEKSFSSTLMVPTVLYNIQASMRIYQEEQFGPIVPVVEYDSIEEVLNYGLQSAYGQQVSIFTNLSNPSASIVDVFSAIFGKININSQCGRSPDSVPFSARRSSGLGVMSIVDALREFSVPTVVSYKNEESQKTVEGIKEQSNFMADL